MKKIIYLATCLLALNCELTRASENELQDPSAKKRIEFNHFREICFIRAELMPLKDITNRLSQKGEEEIVSKLVSKHGQNASNGALMIDYLKESRRVINSKFIKDDNDVQLCNELADFEQYFTDVNQKYQEFLHYRNTCIEAGGFEILKKISAYMTPKEESDFIYDLIIVCRPTSSTQELMMNYIKRSRIALKARKNKTKDDRNLYKNLAPIATYFTKLAEIQ